MFMAPWENLAPHLLVVVGGEVEVDVGVVSRNAFVTMGQEEEEEEEERKEEEYH